MVRRLQYFDAIKYNQKYKFYQDMRVVCEINMDKRFKYKDILDMMEAG
jgi:hypothetical protein